jgi:alkanesulfonate monooxygenase SsuD/methylene tetrahydromethanopterin reductase-like flavin-dependent oxidoreductase (luciferase family)
MKIGVLLPQAAEDGDGGTWPEIARLAAIAEHGGIDSLWLTDHFFYRPDDAAIGSETGYHEPWGLLGALAAVTTRVELGTLVLSTSFRPAGLLAKMAATANEIAAGRLILGLGCGWHRPEYDAFGYPFDHRVGRFEEALRIIAPLVRGERLTFEGTYQSVRDAALLPPPTRRMPILVAATKERMVGLTVKLADQWQTAWYGLPDDSYRERRAAFDAACGSAGRARASIEVTVGIEIGTETFGPSSVPLEAEPLTAAIRAWAAEDVDHIQLGLSAATAATYTIVVEAIARARSAAP